MPPSPRAGLPEMLTISELSALIGKNVRTLANWRCARIGSKFVKLGNSVRYRVTDLEEWIKANRVETEP